MSSRLSPANVNSGSLANRRACVACFKAKTRCVRDPGVPVDGSTCRRCQRLDKECIVVAPAARRQRRVQNTQLAKLEQKLDGLVDLLVAPKRQSSAEDVNSSSTPPGSSTRGSSNAPNASVQSPILPNYQEQGHHEGAPPPLILRGGHLTATFQNQDLNYCLPPGPHAEDLLRFFRTQMAINFPFLIIPPSMSAEELHRDTPFLYAVVLTVASYRDLPFQRATGKTIMRYVSEHCFINGETSLELLQGLLIFLAWPFFQVKNTVGYSWLYRVLQLAVALVVDLRLNEASPLPLDSKQKIMHELLHSSYSTAPEAESQPSIEGKRALLGCYYISSAISTGFRKHNTLTFTPLMEQYCQDLLAAQEFDLVRLVRIEHIVDKINQHALNGEAGELPIGMYVGAFEAELEPLGGEGERMIQLHYHHARNRLYESALRPPPSSSSIENIKHLYACLTSVKQYIHLLLTAPDVQMYAFTFVEWFQLTHALFLLMRLSLLQTPGWDVSKASTGIDASLTVDEVLDRLNECVIKRMDGNADELAQLTGLLKKMKGWYQARSRGLGEGEVEPAQDVGFSQEMLDWDFAGDDGFWRDIFDGTTLF